LEVARDKCQALITECNAEVDQSDNMFEMRAQEQRMAENESLTKIGIYTKTIISGDNAQAFLSEFSQDFQQQFEDSRN